VKRIFLRLGPVGWVTLLALGIPLASSALGEPASDKVVTEQILATINTAAGSSSAAAVTRAPVEEAKRALERASGARRSGDVHHAELLEGLAREWAETARDLVRAASVEADAGTLELAAAEAGVQAERARSLLEEAVARRGRGEAELERLSADGGPFPTKPTPVSSGQGRARAPKTVAPASSAPRGSR
jgi:colicin import membrane protein